MAQQKLSLGGDVLEIQTGTVFTMQTKCSDFPPLSALTHPVNHSIPSTSHSIPPPNPNPASIPPLNPPGVPISEARPIGSWSSVLAANSRILASHTPLHKVVVSKVNGKARVPSSVLEAGINVWKDYVIGYFVEKKEPFKQVRDHLRKAWKDYGRVDIMADQDFFFCYFHDPVMRARAVDEGHIFIEGKYFVVKAWSKEAEMQKKAQTLPIWVKFLDMPKDV
ncbi:hypothetical protein ACHQM5_029466 [Ranunculus cassubicifolius]